VLERELVAEHHASRRGELTWQADRKQNYLVWKSRARAYKSAYNNATKQLQRAVAYNDDDAIIAWEKEVESTKRAYESVLEEVPRDNELIAKLFEDIRNIGKTEEA
jgi:hypothetical protein